VADKTMGMSVLKKDRSSISFAPTNGDKEQLSKVIKKCRVLNGSVLMICIDQPSPVFFQNLIISIWH
jgi:hypothetical protein